MGIKQIKSTTEISKSQRIRQLNQEGLTRKQIAAELGIRYQFVYNVLKREENDAFMKEIQNLIED